MKRLVVTEAATRDLAAIAEYTEQQWGTAQKRRYLTLICDAHSGLAHGTTISTTREEIRSGYRSIATGRHVVFYREADDSIVILRILHQRMDWRRRLTEDPD